MMTLRLSAAAAALQAPPAATDVQFTGISTDTRTLAEGNLFFALSGPRFDGHDHLAAAQQRGAAAAVVSRDVETDLPCLRVADTRLALGALARHWRAQFNMPVVGITGSNGKTTVKEMVTSILAQRGAVLSTQGNLNNDIGVPLTLARLDARYASAVVEMGANHLREIAYLSSLVQPTVGIVINAGPAHLEGFGSLDGVAQGKGELFVGLSADATAVINADDNYAPLWRGYAQGRAQLTFGIDAQADVRAAYSEHAQGTTIKLNTPQGAVELLLPLPGRHNVMNAAGAAAAALAAGADLAAIKAGLENLAGVSGRLQRRTRADGGLVIDDTYNANPASMRAAIDVLRAFTGETVLVLGDMGELGDDAEQLHAEIGIYAQQAGISQLYTLGPHSACAGRAFGPQAHVFDELAALVSVLRERLSVDATVLVKGSRSAGMERVVQALLATDSGARASC